MSIEKARNDLHISGYVHPTNNNTSINQYKIFNTESKKDDYSTSKKKSSYATFTDKETSICPTCNDEALYECDCDLKDKQCSKGHVWYINKYGKITLGDPHD